MLKNEKSQYLNSIFQLNYTRYEKNVMIQNCLLHKDQQVSPAKFFPKIYIKLQKINLYVFKEHKTERDDRIAHPRRARTCKQSELRVKRVDFFFFYTRSRTMKLEFPYRWCLPSV